MALGKTTDVKGHRCGICPAVVKCPTCPDRELRPQPKKRAVCHVDPEINDLMHQSAKAAFEMVNTGYEHSAYIPQLRRYQEIGERLASAQRRYNDEHPVTRPEGSGSLGERAREALGITSTSRPLERATAPEEPDALLVDEFDAGNLRAAEMEYDAVGGLDFWDEPVGTVEHRGA